MLAWSRYLERILGQRVLHMFRRNHHVWSGVIRAGEALTSPVDRPQREELLAAAGRCECVPAESETRHQCLSLLHKLVA